MYALFLILNHKEKLDTILEALFEIGVGATTLDSVGMGKILLDKNVNPSIFESLKHVLNEGKPYNKTMISVFRDEDRLDRAIARIEDILDMENTEGSGFYFVIPVLRCSGKTLGNTEGC